MICFELACQAAHRFEGFFPSHGAFDAQRADGRLSCPECGSTAIHKVLMAKGAGAAPKAPDGLQQPSAGPAEASAGADPSTALRRLSKWFQANAEDVGKGFAAEARKIEAGEAPVRMIRGSCSQEDARALSEAGATIIRVPKVPVDH